MQQQQIERFLMEFAEFDLKHLEMYGFQMVSVDAKTYRWERLHLALVVSHEPIEGNLSFKFELDNSGLSIFAALDVVFHDLGGRGILLSNQFSRPRTAVEFELKRFQWLAMLERIEPYLKDSASIAEVIKRRRNSLLVWPPPELIPKPTLGE
jgi:hypothetical protein